MLQSGKQLVEQAATKLHSLVIKHVQAANKSKPRQIPISGFFIGAVHVMDWPVIDNPLKANTWHKYNMVFPDLLT